MSETMKYEELLRSQRELIDTTMMLNKALAEENATVYELYNENTERVELLESIIAKLKEILNEYEQVFKVFESRMRDEDSWTLSKIN